MVKVEGRRSLPGRVPLTDLVLTDLSRRYTKVAKGLGRFDAVRVVAKAMGEGYLPDFFFRDEKNKKVLYVKMPFFCDSSSMTLCGMTVEAAMAFALGMNEIGRDAVRSYTSHPRFRAYYLREECLIHGWGDSVWETMKRSEFNKCISGKGGAKMGSHTCADYKCDDHLTRALKYAHEQGMGLEEYDFSKLILLYMNLDPEKCATQPIMISSDVTKVILINPAAKTLEGEDRERFWRTLLCEAMTVMSFDPGSCTYNDVVYPEALHDRFSVRNRRVEDYDRHTYAEFWDIDDIVVNLSKLMFGDDSDDILEPTKFSLIDSDAPMDWLRTEWRIANRKAEELFRKWNEMSVSRERREDALNEIRDIFRNICEEFGGGDHLDLGDGYDMRVDYIPVLRDDLFDDEEVFMIIFLLERMGQSLGRIASISVGDVYTTINLPRTVVMLDRSPVRNVRTA